ncbi:hypothetical protein C8R46DRAFT_1058981 [Mycena filopes]|nr:hypothetical protein C8R46DRAFT_1058981 [Mycena filopes]
MHFKDSQDDSPINTTLASCGYVHPVLNPAASFRPPSPAPRFNGFSYSSSSSPDPNVAINNDNTHLRTHNEKDDLPDAQKIEQLHWKAPSPTEREDDDEVMCSASQVVLADNEEAYWRRTQTPSPAPTEDPDVMMYIQSSADDEELDRLRVKTPPLPDGDSDMWSPSSSQMLAEVDVEGTAGKRKRAESPDAAELERTGKKSVHSIDLATATYTEEEALADAQDLERLRKRRPSLAPTEVIIVLEEMAQGVTLTNLQEAGVLKIRDFQYDKEDARHQGEHLPIPEEMITNSLGNQGGGGLLRRETRRPW